MKAGHPWKPGRRPAVIATSQHPTVTVARPFCPRSFLRASGWSRDQRSSPLIRRTNFELTRTDPQFPLSSTAPPLLSVISASRRVLSHRLMRCCGNVHPQWFAELKTTTERRWGGEGGGGETRRKPEKQERETEAGWGGGGGGGKNNNIHNRRTVTLLTRCILSQWTTPVWFPHKTNLQKHQSRKIGQKCQFCCPEKTHFTSSLMWAWFSENNEKKLRKCSY